MKLPVPRKDYEQFDPNHVSIATAKDNDVHDPERTIITAILYVANAKTLYYVEPSS